jgi:hypothetical protein
MLPVIGLKVEFMVDDCFSNRLFYLEQVSEV